MTMILLAEEYNSLFLCYVISHTSKYSSQYQVLKRHMYLSYLTL